MGNWISKSLLENILGEAVFNMKKISALLIALVLSAVATVSTSAAGINDAEQAVIDELQTSVTMKGNTMVISDDYVNQAKNYFNTIEMTDDESKEIVSIIKEGKTFLEGSGASNIADLSYSQKKDLLAYGQEVVGVIDMTMSYDKTNKTLTIKDPNGNVAFNAVPKLVKKDGGSSNTTGNTTTGNTTNTGKGSAVSDGNVIKTTGTNVNTAAVAGVAGTAVAVAALGATYTLKKRKERA